MFDWVAQLVGVAALTMVVLSYQGGTQRRILFLQICGSLLFTIHFGLLGALTGAAINAVSMARAIAFHRYGTRQRRPVWLPVAIGALFVIAGVITWQGVLSVLPIAAMLVSTYAFWQQDAQRLRAIVIGSPPLWLMYNFAVGSIPGIVTELLNLASICGGLWRYRRVKSKLSQ